MEIKKEFYVIEGIDGSGKTSAGRKLAEISPVDFIETPGEMFRQLYGKPAKTFRERFDYFMRSNIFAIEHLSKESVSVIGRYYFSTIIGNALRFNQPFNAVRDLAREYALPESKDTFLLVVDEEEQIRRIVERNKGEHSSNDQIVLDNPDYRKRMNELYLSCAEEKEWHIIDTTKILEDQVAKEILQIIKRN